MIVRFAPLIALTLGSLIACGGGSEEPASSLLPSIRVGPWDGQPVEVDGAGGVVRILS